jgi:uroporphyrinogen-III synthase
MPDPPAGLAGLTVVVARPADQAARLVALLQSEGARALVVPLIHVVDHGEPGDIATALEPLTSDDWVVVASVHAAQRVLAPLVGCPAHVAAVGATTAASLPRVDLVPAVQSADGLLQVFPHAPPTGGRVVVAQAVGGAPTLVDGLAERGWTVVRVDTHRSHPIVPSAAQQLAVLQADVVLFTSGSQAQAWVEVFGTATPAIVAAIGPQTSRVAAACGLKVDVVAADHSLLGVVRAVVRFLDP